MINNTWFEDESEQSEIENVANVDYDITSVPNDFNIGTLYNFIESGIVKIPDFQRNFVWDKKRASKLIESILIGLPIPQLFFYEAERNKYLIIDGQQRLLSIYFFIKQRFPRDEARGLVREEFEEFGKISEKIINDDKYFSDFKLTLDNTKSNFHGKKFSTLESDVKGQFEHMRSLRTIVVKQNSPDDSDSSMFEIFNRLNTGGQNLSAQEIRLSLYYSDFYSALSELNKESKWREILQKSELDVRAKDIEFLLRVFALLIENGSYSQPMKKFLNEFSKKSRSYGKVQIEYLKNLILSFFDACSNLDLKEAFINNGKFSITFFDAVFVAICSKSFEKQELVNIKIDGQKLSKLRVDKEFNQYCLSQTSHTKNVEGRISLAVKYFFE